MVKNLLAEHFIALGTVTGKITIDRFPNDKYLAYSRNGNPGSGANSTTIEAVRNLRDGGAVKKVIIGHGGVAHVSTGNGPTPRGADQFFGLRTEYAWELPISTLKGWTDELWLYACNPALTSQGAEFIYRIARHANCKVYAPNNYICVDEFGNFHIESPGEWVMATPNQKPEPVLMQKPWEDPLDGKLAFYDPAGPIEFKFADIQTVTFTPRVFDVGRSLPLWVSSGTQSREFLSEAGISGPIKGNCKLAITISGVLSFATRTFSRSLIVLDDRLLEDTQFPGVYYCCHPTISAAVMKFL